MKTQTLNQSLISEILKHTSAPSNEMIEQLTRFNTVQLEMILSTVDKYELTF